VKKILASTYFLFVSCPAIAAQAADPEPSNQATQPRAASPEQTATPVETSSARLEEIVVTAQRREESLQKTSLALEVLSADALERAGVAQTEDLSRVTPGVQIGLQGNATQTFIRGVGDFSQNARAQGAVAYSVDGVYIARGTAISPSMFDLARVEVLKGPQGTLYGRNASGGAINLITQRPELREFTGEVGMNLGNYSLRQFNGAVNIPAGDTFATRIAFQTTDRDGYFTDGSGDQESRSGRIRAFYEPTDTFSLLMNAEVGRERGQGSGMSVLPEVGGDPWTGATSPEIYGLGFPFILGLGNDAAVPYGGYITSLFATPTLDPQFLENDLWSASVELNADVGIGTLTIIPGYRYQDYDANTFGVGFSFHEKYESRQQSFEARLANQTDLVRWVFGAYYFREKLDSYLNVDSILAQDRFFSDNENEAWAVFGEATFSVTDTLRLIAGARYTDETQQGGGDLDKFPHGSIDALLTGDVAASDYTWKGGVEFDVTDDSMLFLTVATGFKAGGWMPHPFSAAVPNTFEPEEVIAYELGSRNRLFDDQLQLNLEAFYWKYNDQQVAHVGFDGNGAPTLRTENVGESSIRGVDVDVVWQPTAADRIHAGLEYLDATYDKFTYEYPGFLPTPVTGCDVSGGGLSSYVFDCSGFEAARAPEWSANVGYERRFGLPNGAQLIAAIDGMYIGERWLTLEFTPNSRADDVIVGNASLEYNADDRWSVRAWIRNIGDEPVYTGGFSNVLNANVVHVSVGPPRTYGASVDFNF
jgi:iron complex outermembrane recepter protein